jgi:hypothetical protein
MKFAKLMIQNRTAPADAIITHRDFAAPPTR